MNLLQFYHLAKGEMEHLPEYADLSNVSVLINQADRWVHDTGNPAIGIRDVYLDFDWERLMLRIVPDEKLIRFSNTLRDERPIHCQRVAGMKVYWCPKCEQKVRISDSYCRHCGQKLGIPKDEKISTNEKQ